MANSDYFRWAALVLIACLPCGIARAQEAKENDGGEQRLNIQFNKGLDAHPDLKLFGADAEFLHKVEPQGLRLTLAVVRDGSGDVGVELQKALRGDFEITLAYELLTLPNPGPEGGAGVVLEAFFETPDSKVRIARTQKTKGAFFGSTYYVRNKEGRLIAQPQKYPGASEKIRTGKLRLTRTGTDLAFQIDEGGAGFRTIANKEVGGANVASVRAFATSGNRPFLVDLRFSSLELRWNPTTKVAAPAPVDDIPPAPAANPPAVDSHIWLFAAAGVGFLFIVLLAVVIVARFLLRQSPRAKSQDTTPATSVIAFACPECGKNLRVKANLAGKKVKCTHCGKGALVPEAALKDGRIPAA